MKQQKKQQLGNISNDAKEVIHKLQMRDASQRLDIAKLKEALTELTLKYHKALKQIGEMEKIQKRDLDYILKMDAFINQVKIKQEEGSRKAQTEQYVDALLEMTRQRDELKRKNEFLEVRIAELQEVNIQLQRKLDVRRILPQQSQQQFTLPLCAGEELADEQRKHSIFSFHTQDSVNGYDNACDNNCDFDQSEDTLMQFLQQLDSKQATQLYSLFSQIDEEHSNQIIQKMLTDSSQQSIFSFTQKIE